MCEAYSPRSPLQELPLIRATVTTIINMSVRSIITIPAILTNASAVPHVFQITRCLFLRGKFPS